LDYLHSFIFVEKHPMNKTAVDQAAKDYWSDLFGEYGDALCRDIPRRIKAALLANKKVASVDDSRVDIKPVASAKDGDNFLVEGLYCDESVKLLFKATLDKAGQVSAVETLEVR
jgi:hypothetical protein